MFDSVLVANRGEIAVRIIRTLRRLGIRAVAVYSDAESDAPHVRAADGAIRIGPARAADSYLRIDRIVEAALSSGAGAVHPGYGFLSENADFAAACAASGVVFVGPPRAAIIAMGDKIRAKATVARAGVRVVPGSEEPGLSDDALAEAAVATGFPVLVKPSAGGGGKGMHVVSSEPSLMAAIASARREAIGAFGDGNLLVERYIDRPRHIEIQVLADAHGHVVHLGERECSLQRRHQKIIEEAPSPLLSPERRAAMGEQAVAAAKACGYENAGTVEFIVSGADPDDAFFMEMNTRLQVEHPVTEMVWGLDLVEWQLRIAGGEALGFTQDELRSSGHAIEARVYGEDPQRGFLPSGGRVLALTEPTGDGVRVDSGLAVGVEIGGWYDPMLAKVVAWGPDRQTALGRLDRALAGTSVLGVTTNIGFLRALIAHPDVAAGELDTGLVERALDSLVGRDVPDSIVAAAALSAVVARDPLPGPLPAAVADPWLVRSGWRLGAAAWTSWSAQIAEQKVTAALRGEGRSREIRIGDGEAVAVQASWDGGELVVGLAGSTTRCRIVRVAATVWVGCEGSAWMFVEPDPIRPNDASRSLAATGAVTSPMPGTVVFVLVGLGDVVTAGAALVVVEAMKMEHTVTAPHDGTVVELPVATGQKVSLSQLLVRIDAHGGEGPERKEGEEG